MPQIEPPRLGEIFRLHAPALLLYARQWCGSAEDLVQNAFVTLARRNPTPEQILPWLFSVVRNEALKARRAAGRRHERERRAGIPETWFHPVEDKLDGDEAVRQLAELPLDLREAIVARIWGGLTFEDIAVLVGCSLATAHRRYRTGLAQLRERLESQCIPNPTPQTT